MKYILSVITIAFIATACTHQKPTADNKNTIIVPEKKLQTVDTISPKTDTTHQLSSYSCTRTFSNSASNDNFSITLYGKSILTGNVVFKIIDHANNQLFKETFSAIDLLGDMEDVLNKKQQVDTIKFRMVHFFDQSNFVSLAIKSNEKIDDDLDTKDNTDIKNWNDIKADATGVKFSYSYGYEGSYGIAFSKKKKKVVQIFYGD